jgi:hypothetical protein
MSEANFKIKMFEVVIDQKDWRSMVQKISKNHHCFMSDRQQDIAP